MMKRINITLEENLLSQMDEFASERGISRSALIASSARDYMSAVESLPEISKQVNELQLQLANLQKKTARKTS